MRRAATSPSPTPASASPPEHIPRLTERFYRVDAGRSRATGGSGLGLAIVKHVLQRHGAQLSIESEEGRGSTFTCHFPRERVRTRGCDVRCDRRLTRFARTARAACAILRYIADKSAHHSASYRQ